MKNILAIIICLALFLPLAGCGNAPESPEPFAGAVKWFDTLNGDQMVWDGVREYDLDDFPGVTFRWYAGHLDAVTEKEIVTLYTGMPIWSVYFCDLTGDGKPELCSTLSIGSGMVDNRIVVFDYAGGASYELADRGQFDYVLTMQEGALAAEKRGWMQDDLVESGELILLDGAIQIKTEE